MIRKLQEKVILRMLGEHTNCIVLDIGCGTGFLTYKLARKCGSAIGIDLHLPSLGIHQLTKSLSMTMVKADALRLPIRDKSVTVIILSSVLQVIRDDECLLSECQRLLKNKGELILTFPTEYMYFRSLNRKITVLNHLWSVEGKGYYRPTEVIRLLSLHGFKVLDMEYAPKLIGSLFWELWVKIYLAFRNERLEIIYFTFFYPIAYLDNLLPRNSKGIELSIRAEKTNG